MIIDSSNSNNASRGMNKGGKQLINKNNQINQNMHCILVPPFSFLPFYSPKEPQNH